MLNSDVLYRGSENNNVLLRVGIPLIVGLLSLAVGLWLGSTVLDSSGDKVSELQAEVQGLQSDLGLAGSESQVLVEDLAVATQMEENLRMQLSQAKEQASSNLQALEQVAALEKQVQSIQSQVAKEQGKLEAIRGMADTVERHRLLLVELRKDLPLTREEAEAYWDTMKAVASRADPALASPADKVILKIDNYFDWSERRPNPTAPFEEYMDWLADQSTSGATAYVDANVTFDTEALLSVISQMDTVVSRLN